MNAHSAPVGSSSPAHAEEARIEELKQYAILDTPRDGAFDDITQLASRYFNTPIAIVSLVDHDRVWFKSACGLGDVTQIDRGPGLCASAIMQDKAYVARDLREDPNSLTNPLVATENGLRFYAAAPLKSANGYNLGTFCVLDTVPREFDEEDEKDLQRFAGLVMAQMDHLVAGREIVSLAKSISDQNVNLSYAASHDPLTGLHNRAAATFFLEELQKDSDIGNQSTVLLLDIDHFKSINDTHGHDVGDQVLVEVAKSLKTMVRATDHVVRFGGEEFLIILKNCPPKIAEDISERICRTIASRQIALTGLDLTITISGGLCHTRKGRKVAEMIKAADDSLYAAKRSGRNRIIMSDLVATHIR